MSFYDIDAVLYINLEHRKDRKALLVQELKNLKIESEKIIRIEACHDLLNGHRGCALSHIKALTFAKNQGLRHVLILEDDVTFIKDRKTIDDTLKNFFHCCLKPWNVFFLGAAVFDAKDTLVKSFKKVLNAECAHSYVVHNNYYSILIECYQQALNLMTEDVDFSDSTFRALDQTWKTLQKQDNWFIGPMMTQQRRSYSDIEHVIKQRKHHEYYY